jgi:hypothetical protein
MLYEYALSRGKSRIQLGSRLEKLAKGFSLGLNAKVIMVKPGTT